MSFLLGAGNTGGDGTSRLKIAKNISIKKAIAKTTINTVENTTSANSIVSSSKLAHFHHVEEFTCWPEFIRII